MNLPRRIPASPGARGFTLVELILALSLGAVLVVSMATAAQRFAGHVQESRDTSDFVLDESVDLICEGVRHAWVVERPTATQLDMDDAYGNRTTVFLDGNELKITRPAGDTGTLIAGVDDVDFTIDATHRRYREDAPYDENGTWFTAPTLTGPELVLVDDKESVAFGFFARAEAPPSVPTVDAVEETLIEATLGTATVLMGYLPPMDPPAFPGDTGTVSVSNSDKVLVELYESWGLRDARPYGPLIASINIKANSLPSAGWTWEEIDLDDPEPGKSLICHIPPGNPGNLMTLSVGDPAMPSHVEHGDYVGPCVGDTFALVAVPPALSAVVDLTGLGTIPPGKGYTLVFRFSGKGQLAFGMTPLATSRLSGVATLTDKKAGLQPQPIGIPLSIAGAQTFTQTQALDVVSRVLVTLDMDDGRSVSATAGLLGQRAVSDPWLGPVPGEMPTLELAGQ